MSSNAVNTFEFRDGGAIRVDQIATLRVVDTLVQLNHKN